ncbi:MAG: hypothetical protein ABI399_07180 [Bauldia sp.]
MRWLGLAAAVVVGGSAVASAADGVSVDFGKHVSIIGGCHDCHTMGYNESGGQIDPAKALVGSSVGFQGPWGTTYAMNLRITLKDKSEDQFVEFARTFKARPPMPFYNVNALSETEVRSLYQYIKSLGEPGNQAPQALAPGETPKTPYIPFAPPVMPK